MYTTDLEGRAPTGVIGLDALAGGGVPRAAATLVTGSPGAGKTVLGLQYLVHGASLGEPGILVAFEERADRLRLHAKSFGWKLGQGPGDPIVVLEAQPTADVVHTGAFDTHGLLAVLGAMVETNGAKRVVFDSIDAMLSLFAEERDARREAHRIHEWLLSSGLSAMLTARDGVVGRARRESSFVEFMVDCVIALEHETSANVSQRSIRILKYRGSAHDENAQPFVIGPRGIEVAIGADARARAAAAAPTERVSSGVDALDAMLNGGYFRGSSILITGAPGAAKTTLLGAYAVACCERGERVVLASFDSTEAELVRNLASVGLALDRPIAEGRLRVVSPRTADGSAEVHFSRLRREVEQHQPTSLLIDPVSTLAADGNELTAHGVVGRLVDWAKGEGLTLLCASLIDDTSMTAERTALQISTIADAWLHLSYVVHAGERNRALTIVKARGTAHSPQVRELVLSHEGVELSDVYASGGEVLLGTLRFEKEREVALERQRRAAEDQARRLELDLHEAEIEARMAALRREMEFTRAQQGALAERATHRADHAGVVEASRKGSRGNPGRER